MSDKKLIIYHGGCPDGFTAAWACTRRFGRDDCELFPGYYGTDPPDVSDRDVYIVDFSYPRQKLQEMYGNAKSIQVYDHHKTAQKDLEGLSFAYFDMERSGAGITWDLLHMGQDGHADRPWLIDYVEDRDLWRFALPNSRAVTDYIMAQPYDLDVWDHMYESMSLDDAVNAGFAIRMKIDSYCQAMLSNAVIIEWEGKKFPIINAPQVMISDLLHVLCELDEPDDCSPMAMGWWQRRDGSYQFSLRSVGDLDVSAIAKRYGGGGHKNAAGFTAHRRPEEFHVWADHPKAQKFPAKVVARL